MEEEEESQSFLSEAILVCWMLHCRPTDVRVRCCGCFQMNDWQRWVSSVERLCRAKF